jgi:hypothetical protein
MRLREEGRERASMLNGLQVVDEPIPGWKMRHARVKRS